MGKIINSNSILKLARAKSKRMDLYFDCHNEIRDKPVIEQMLYFCFLNVECLYKDKNITSEDRKKLEALFESKAQEFANQIYPQYLMYNKLELNLQSSLKEGDYETAIQILSNMLDFSRLQVFEGKYSALCEKYIQQYEAEPEEDII